MTDAAAPGIIIVTCPPCLICGESAVMPVNREQFAQWRAGTHAQRAFPDMSKDLREQLISGTHPKCWEILWANEDD